MYSGTFKLSLSLGNKLLGLCFLGILMDMSSLIAAPANEALAKKREEQNSGLGSPTSFFFRAQPGKATSRAFYENRYEHLRVPSTDSPETEYLLSGESMKPGVLVNHNSIGFGLFGNVGSHKIKNVNAGRRIDSIVRHRGLGLELTYSPGDNVKQRIGFYARGSFLHAHHETTLDSDVVNVDALPRTDYLIYEREIGAHYRIDYWDFIFVYPWISYQARSVEFRHLDAGSQNVEKKSNLGSDAETLWKIEPEIRYGIDVALKIYAFDLHIGNGLRHLANILDPRYDRKTYQNRTFSLSLSYTSNTN